jgi:PAS domain S-box-containing protein
MIDTLRTKALTSYFHNSGQFYYVLTDLLGNCFYVNPLFLQQNGFAEEDIQGVPFSSFIPSGESDRYMAIIKECVANPDAIVAADLHHHLPDGSYILVRWEFQALPGEYNEADGIQCIGTRIREISQSTTAITSRAISNSERYRAYELSTQGLWRLDLEIPASIEWTTPHIIEHCRKYGFMAECNDQMAKMYGLQKASDIVGMRMDSLMNLDQPKQLEYLAKFIDNGYTIAEAETEEHDINGKRIYFLNNMTGIVEDGMLKRVWGTQQDITEKKKAEEQLLRSELFYRNLIGDSLDGILLTDTNGLITFASPSVQKILGYTPEELVQTSAFIYVHPDDQVSALSAFQDEVRMEPLTKFIDIRLKTKKGEWIYCNVRGHNMLYNPYVSRMVIYFQDDTQRKKTEHALRESEHRHRESEHRFRHLINNVRTGVLMFDNEGKIVLCNPTGCELLGLSEKQLLGVSALDPRWNVVRDDGTEFSGDTRPVMTAIRTKQPAKDVVMGLYRAGTNDLVWLLVNAEPALDDAGNVLHVICSFADITEQRRLSQELVDQEIQRQKLLTQATIDGQEKERREIGKELHDNISQHLTTTRLYLEVAQEKTVSQEVREMIFHAHKELTEIINEIRKLSQSLVPPTLGDIGLVESVQDVCDSLKRTHTIGVDFHHRSFTEETIPDNMKLMLFRIIQEQINNIIRHAGASIIQIWLRGDAESLELLINDNGKGFDPSVNGKKGLGFTNIINRVGLFNGKVDLQSAPGKGCTVLVTVPLK